MIFSSGFVFFFRENTAVVSKPSIEYLFNHKEDRIQRNHMSYLQKIFVPCRISVLTN